MPEITQNKPSTVHDNKGDLFASFDVEDFAVPRAKDEVWRFIPLRRLKGLHDGSFKTAAPADIAVDIPADATGATYEKVDRDDPRLGRTGGGVDRVAAQAWSSSTDGHVITVDADADIAEPIVVTVTGKGKDVTTFGALSVEIGRGASVSIELHYVGSGVHADNAEFIIGEASNVNVVVYEDWEFDAVHVGAQTAVVGQNAVLRHAVATFGGGLVRIQPRISFAGQGADAEMLGVCFAGDGQFFEHRLLVDHNEPNCRSNVMYKGALLGDPSTTTDARTSWVGEVLIRHNALNTDTYESSRNLLLSEGARADAVPNLEIETGSVVGAGHAATVGRFDDEQMFYLLARGIPETQARKLIVHGFFAEVINKIPDERVRSSVEARINNELHDIAL